MAVQNARPSPFTNLTTSLEWERLCAGLGTYDGVDEVPGGTGLQPSLDGSNRWAVMAAGRAVIKGQLWSCDANVNTSIPAASAQNRIDRLVLRLSRTAGDATSFLQPAIVQGTPSGSPVVPNLTQTTTGIYEVPIARWTSASNGNLTGLIDERQFVGLAVSIGTSTNRPTVTKPRLLVETDTKDLRYWDGSSWVKLNAEQPTAWQNFGAASNGWHVDGHAKYKKTGEGLLVVSIHDFNCSGGTKEDNTTIFSAANGLDTDYRPASNRWITCRVDVTRDDPSGRSEGPSFNFFTDGHVECYGIASTASSCDFHHVFNLD